MKTGDLYCLEFSDGRLYIGACVFGGAKVRYKAHAQLAVNGSTAPVHEAWRKLGAPKMIVLRSNVPEKKLWSFEKKAIIKYDTKIPHGCNAVEGRDVAPGMLGKKHTEEIKQKWSIDRKGHEVKEETRKKIGLGNAGRKHTENSKKNMGAGQQRRWENQEERNKYRQSHLGKTNTEKSKQKMSAAHKGQNNHMFGKHHSIETKEAIRQANLGRKHTEKTKQQMSKTKTGIKFSDEHKERLRQALLGKKHTEEHRENNRQAALKREAKKRELKNSLWLCQ